MTDMGKNLLLWLIIAAVLLTVFNNFNVTAEPETVTYSDFIEQVRNDNVKEVVIDGLIIYGIRRSGEEFQVIRPDVYDQKLLDDLYNHNVQTEGKLPEQQSIWAQLLIRQTEISDPSANDRRSSFRSQGRRETWRSGSSGGMTGHP